MQRYFLIFGLMIVLFGVASSQEGKIDQKSRSEKIEDILRIQDTRTVHDSKLLSLLSDPDPVVRARATFAYGSIQDTTVIDLLVTNLMNSDRDVSFAAAFAIGQTASALQKQSKETLQHDLIWIRLDQLRNKQPEVFERMVEEIGKFGTDEGLKDLVLRFGSEDPMKNNNALIMGITRFAFRNILVQDATRYLVKQALTGDAAPWQAVYALQRIGNSDDIAVDLNNLIPLYRNSNPLIRMYFASLLGKIKNEQLSIDPLVKLAEFDSDWRVRVNALKALANFKVENHDDAVEAIYRSITDGNEYVGFTALEVLANTGLRETMESRQIKELFSRLRTISENKDNGYEWWYQAKAAYALARLSGIDAVRSIQIKSGQDKLLIGELLRALGEAGDLSQYDLLADYFEGDNPYLSRNALDALDVLTHKHEDDSTAVLQTYQFVLAGLKSDDVALVTTAAEILTDSIFMRNESVGNLIERLSRLRVPDDVEAIQAICTTLGKYHDTKAINSLNEILHQPDRSVQLSAASALKSITGKDYSKDLSEWIMPLWTDFDFSYLSSLRDTLKIKIETTRGDIFAQFYKNVAPFSVMAILKLANQKGYYRGLNFHRVVPNFVIQGGDPRGDGWGGPGFSLRSEFSTISYDEGVIGLASAGKDTEGSQFFITQSPQPHLDGKYTVIGKVTSGMDVVDKIRMGDRILDLKIRD